MSATIIFSALSCFCVILFISSFLIGFSWRTINYDQYGLLYSTVTREVENKTYDSGRYYVGLGKDFHRFPKNFQNIEYNDNAANAPLNIRATDGQTIVVELSFQYRLKKSQLYDLFSNLRFEYEKTYISKAKGKIRDVAQNYTSRQFFDARDVIETNMLIELNKVLEIRHASLEGFQLRKIDLPTTLDNELLNIELKKQDAFLVEAQRNATEIRRETSNLVKQIEAASDKELGELAQKIELDRLVVAEKVAAISEETERQIAEFDTETATYLTVFNAETTAQETAIEEAAKLVREETKSQVQQIQSDIDILEANANLQIQKIRSDAEATAQEISNNATIQVLELSRQVQGNAIQDIVNTLGVNVTTALELLWVEAIETHDQGRISIDLYTPSSVYLPGQKDKFDAAFATP